MNAARARAADQPGARSRLLDAAMQAIREKGYAATTVDDICGAAGATKGAFFHHFKSKEDLGVAAATHFAQMAEKLFGGAPYTEFADPLDRLLGYIDFRAALLSGPIAEFTCLFGTMVQEAYDSHPAIREACETYIVRHAARVGEDIGAAKALYAPDASWSAESLGLYTQAVLQGSFILAKAKGGPEVARECVAHLRRYILQLFHRPTNQEGMTTMPTYIDGFVAAVPTAKREVYKKHAELAAPVFKEHGALKMVECWGDDVPDGKLTSFPMAVKKKDDETVVFSWIVWPSRKARDEGMKKVMADPRLQPDVNPMPFDGKRLIYGGFEVLLEA